MRYLFLSVIIIIPLNYIFCQNPSFVKFYPTVISCFDSSLIYANVVLYKVDSICAGMTYEPYDTTEQFVLVADGKYSIKISGYEFGQAEYEIYISQENEIHQTFIVGKLFPEEELFYNTSKAKNDIENGIVRLFYFGLVIKDDEFDNFLKSLFKEYGFFIENLGCNTSPELYQGVQYYNREVNKYLDSINISSWRTQMENRIEVFEKNRK